MGNLVNYATHLPLLVRVFTKSNGPVLEIGTGYFSTLVLRWLCEMSGRRLVSYENNIKWYEKAFQKPKPFHTVIYVDSFDDIPTDQYWGLIFIDHGPNRRRIVEIERLADKADYIVIHDTDEKGYNYDKIWGLFKYRYDFKLYKPWTTVVSNFKKLNAIK